MHRGQLSLRQRSPGALALARDWFDILFDTAPVMMHGIDRDFRIVKVNRRWLEALGYESNEVLGRKPTDFQTEDSRARAESDVLPLFWRAGSLSMARQFVRKEGEVLDILIDAEVCRATTCECSAYGTLTDIHDLKQWEEASKALKTLKDITTIQHILERVLVGDEGDDPDVAPQGTKQLPGWVSQTGEWGEAAAAFLELAQDISANLRGLLHVYEGWLSESTEQQRELVLSARSLDRSFAALADTLAAVRLPPE